MTDINQLNAQLRKASRENDLETIKYVLTSPDLSIHADINVDEDYVFRMACEKGYTDIVKYVVSSPELQKHADIYTQGGRGLWTSCHIDNREVIDFLIIDQKMVLSDMLKSDLREKGTGSFKYAADLPIIELHNKLNRTLDPKETTMKREKI